MFKKHFFVAVGLLLVPVFAHAAVAINEVAWMGTSESQYGEWLELYNDSAAAVDLKDWKLYEGGGATLIFTLMKSIPANGYLVIERTTASTPDPLPSIHDEAGSFGGGGLTNTGESLVLKDASGVTIDSINASAGWPAGDADTKQTMQKSSSGWITAAPTPDAGNAQTQTTSTDTTDTTSVDTETQKAEPAQSVLYASISGPSTLTMNIEGVFTPQVGWTGGAIFPAGRFFWNFGDGDTIIQKTNDPVHHTYARAGKYVVLLEYSRNYYTDIPDVSYRLTVTVPALPMTFSMLGENVSLKNTGTSEIDISGFAIHSAKNTLVIPHGTILLAGAEIAFPVATFGGKSESISFLYPNGTVFSSISPAPIVRPTVVHASIQKTAAPITESVIPIALAASTAAVADSIPVQSSGNLKMILTSAGFLLLVLAAVVLFMKVGKSKNPSLAGEGEITANDIKIIESEE